MTIRLRLIVYYTGLLTIILILFGTTVYSILNWTMRSQIDTTLETVLEDVLEETGASIEINDAGEPQLRAYVSPLDTFRTSGIYVQIWYVNQEQPILLNATENLGAYDEPLDPDYVLSAHESESEVTISDVHLSVITRPVMAEDQTVMVVQAAASLATIEAASNRLLQIMLGAGLIAFLLSLLIGDWLARRTLYPISTIVSTAQSISVGDDLQQRIPNDGPQDELGYMITAFNATLSRLERSFLAQKRFVGDVSHELRTPLTTIQGNIDLMRLYEGGDTRSTQAIESEVKRMSRLVDDLLLLAKADSGTLPLRFSEISLDQLILEVYQEAVLFSKNKYIIRLGTFDTDITIEGSSDRLKQLFLNLVTNAIKYTPEGGTVTMSVEKIEDGVKISVTDTGVGIPPEDLEHIFDRFYRVDKARSRAAGGTGLGLSIAQWIVEAHHGTVKVESTVGEGTVFEIILPLTQPHSQKTDPNENPIAHKMIH